MINVLLVALGGAIGACMRYALVGLVRPMSPGFPTGTLLANLAGCAAIGLLAGWLMGGIGGTGAAGGQREQVRLFLFVGVLGGFTTFSSFALEVTEMVRAGRWGAAGVYVVVSNVVGLGLAVGGYALAERGVGGGA
ncbi:MAG: CrcB family protein [Planctomycetaceae bacterium]|nr:CrcB family protein [Planctomycetaceae bacterium]